MCDRRQVLALKRKMVTYYRHTCHMCPLHGTILMYSYCIGLHYRIHIQLYGIHGLYLGSITIFATVHIYTWPLEFTQPY